MRRRDHRQTTLWTLPRWMVLVVGLSLVVLGLRAEARAQTSDVDERQDRVELELERTDELLQRVWEQVGEADVPKAREYMQMAQQVQNRAREIFRNVREDTLGPVAAAASLRQSLQLTLKARDMGQQAGRRLHELVSFEDNAKRLIDRANEMFDRLREPVADSGNARAAEFLSQARRKIELAEQQYRDGNYEIALNLAENAVRLMENIETAGRDALRERLEEELRRTRDFLDRATEQVGDSNGPAARRLARAEELLRQAHESTARGQLLMARRQLEQCQNLLRQLIADAGGEIEAGDVERGIERLTGDLQRLRDTHGDDLPDAARRVLNQVIQERDRAQRALAEGDTKRAVRHLRAANDLLVRLQRMLEDRRG